MKRYRYRLSFVFAALFFIAIILGFALQTQKVYATTGASTAHLSVEKTVFKQGESIMITATAQNAGEKDWVAIMRGDDAAAEWAYIRYAYIETSVGGAGSGVAFDITKAPYVSGEAVVADYLSFPAGEYFIAFIPQNKSAVNNITERLYITIVDAVIPAPSQVTYTLTNPTSGFAGGTVSVTFSGYASLPSYQKPTDIVSYWGDASGTPLADYTALAKQKVTGESTQYTIFSNIIIPAEARTLVVYGSNASELSQPFAYTLPQGCQFNRTGTLQYEFQVVSDAHLNDSSTHLHNRHFENMLIDVATTSPDSKGVFVVGDLTDTATAAQYNHSLSIYNEVKTDYPTLADLYVAIGNHELKNGTTDGYGDYQERISTFLTFAQNYANGAQDKVYFDTWIEGCHFIFLGSEWCSTSIGKDAYLSDEQLAWFEQTLAEDYAANRPIFVFLHNSLYNTVSGSLPGQNWNGIIAGGEYRQNVSSTGDASTMLEAEKKFRKIIADYPEIMMFNGHTHWTLNSTGAMYVADGTLPYIFNTASVGYLWDDYSSSGDYLKGSQGYYVRVYTDGVEVLGRDFTTGQWVPTACFASNTDDLHTHAYEDEYQSDDTHHWRECTGCSEKFEKTAHTTSEWLTVDESSVPNGYRYQKCTVCGKILRQEQIPVASGCGSLSLSNGGNGGMLVTTMFTITLGVAFNASRKRRKKL